MKKPEPVETRLPASPQVAGMVERVANKTGSPLYRRIETFAFVAAIVQLLGYQTVELLHRADVIHVNQAHEGFPWGTLISSVILISPKVIGKAFAGRALVAIAGGQTSGTTAERPTEGP
jgi:hypothetical protein